MRKIITISTAFLAAVSLSACSASPGSTNNNSASSVKKTHSKYYFDGKTANLHDVKIHIDKVSYYPKTAGSEGKNLICFDYTITNKTDKDIDALTGWQAVFNAYQDNKNTEGKLDVGPMPDDTSDQILHDQDQTIKKGGTVKCRTAYELDSNSKPVVLKATQGMDGKYLGKKTYKLNKLRSQESQTLKSDNNSSVVTTKGKADDAESKSQKNSKDDNDSAYYSSLSRENENYWKNLSPEERASWSQWQDGESRANDPYQNGQISGPSTQPSDSSN